MEDSDNKKRPAAKGAGEMPATAAAKAGPVSCLRKERVILRFVPKSNALVQTKGHVLYGGMGERSERTFVVPVLRNGSFVNVLTNDEKEFLEEYMGLERNALGVTGIGKARWTDYRVKLYKHDTYLDLSDPEDYIRYKVLLANTDLIAPSPEEMRRRPKASYQYVMIREGESGTQDATDTKSKAACYAELSKIMGDRDTLKVVVEIMERHPVAERTETEWLIGRCGSFIDAQTERMHSVLTDRYLPTRVLLSRGVECGAVLNRSSLYYLKEGNQPLCETGEQPTADAAVVFLNTPRNTQFKLAIEAAVNKAAKA